MKSEIQETDLCWHDASTLTVEGKGWRDAEVFYERLPAKARGMVN